MCGGLGGVRLRVWLAVRGEGFRGLGLSFGLSGLRSLGSRGAGLNPH